VANFCAHARRHRVFRGHWRGFRQCDIRAGGWSGHFGIDLSFAVYAAFEAKRKGMGNVGLASGIRQILSYCGMGTTRFVGSQPGLEPLEAIHQQMRPTAMSPEGLQQIRDFINSNSAP
jgi:hypothetical protein